MISCLQLLAAFSRRVRRWSIVGVFAGMGMASAQENTSPLFRDATFEELANITVRTVSKHEERLFLSPAAVTVLSGDEIIRSGATSVSEALRWVPGLDVAQINAAEWAISARGFNARFSNKLLVLADGRSLYTPLFAGVYWDMVNPMLEDLDRVEVVRGPGGALWGANAVNGVINIISKSARETQGALIYGGGGTEKLVQTGVRQGWALNDHSWMRVYASYHLTDDSRWPDGRKGHDGFHVTQGGFRYDTVPAGPDRFTLQGDVFQGRRNQVISLVTPGGLVVSDRPVELDGFNLLGRWTRELATHSTLTLQSYWDHTARDSVSLVETRDTFDVDLQHNLFAGERQHFIWGAGYRISRDKTVAGLSGGFVPADYDFHLFNGFAQDEITLIPDRWQLTLGSKWEHNRYTGFEFQPSIRLRSTPDARQTFWASVSRAVRNPNRADRAVNYDVQYVAPGPGVPLPVIARAYGNPAVEAEGLVAWEAGWRFQPHPHFSADLSFFYHDYDRMILGLPNQSGAFLEANPAPLHLVTPVILDNNARAKSYGAELAFVWQPSTSIRLMPYYSFLQVDAALTKPGNGSVASLTDTAPQHQGGLRQCFDLPRATKLDLNFRWVGAVPAYAVRPYFEADVRVAWAIRPGLEWAITGQNLFHTQHSEFGPQTTEPRYELQRAGYAKLTCRF